MKWFALLALAFLTLPLPAAEPATGDRDPAQALRPKLVTGTEPIPAAPTIDKLIADLQAARAATTKAQTDEKVAEAALAKAWKELADKIAALGLQPPPPPDEFEGDVDAALKTEMGQKALMPTLVQFYKQCPAYVDNPANDTTAKLFGNSDQPGVLLVARRAVLRDDQLAATRHAVDKQLLKALGADADKAQPLTPELRKAIKAVFAKAVAKLEK